MSDLQPLLAAIAFPNIDPVALDLGFFQIRWYALSYIVGLLLAWRYARWLTEKSPSGLSKEDMDDFLVWATLGVVLGGRIGYVLFYQPGQFADNPLSALALWQGGMAFHGGLLGVIAAMWLYMRKRAGSFLHLTDMIGCAAPIGIFLGRLANFANGELYGRVTDVSWGMIFPGGGPEPRHPSQLYQASLEGLLLFLLLFALVKSGGLKHKGYLSGWFLVGYGSARIVGELFRQPDAYLGFLFAGATMGQLLSLPMVLGGLALIFWSRRSAPAR
uniref:prolipoprotein diacylglyceryl transferase n=1 Tax=Algihabitans albus TaxID=2164067 RepID=UPI001F4763B9|nr:prolipoprotein diacylglyceryl transferase [Algihabitans albus]